jgi:type VI secretion system secreted protein Hcp
MSADYFLKIDGVKGESTDSKHPDTIEIHSWSFGVSRPSTISASGAGTGKASFQDIHFTTFTVDSSGPMLFQLCASGKHIANAILFVRKQGGDQTTEYLQITMQDCIVSAITTGDLNGDGTPDETFSLAFTKILIDYTPQSATGQTQSPVHAGWDIKANKAI